MANEWNTRAKETRAQAERINDPEAKSAMLRVAAIYDQIAARAQERADRIQRTRDHLFW
jgi:hypothetical protein